MRRVRGDVDDVVPMLQVHLTTARPSNKRARWGDKKKGGGGARFRLKTGHDVQVRVTMADLVMAIKMRRARRESDNERRTRA